MGKSKSDIGTLLMGMGLLQILFVISQNELYFPIVVIGFSYFIVRTGSFFVDGSHPTIGIVMELVVPLLAISLHRLSKTS